MTLAVVDDYLNAIRECLRPPSRIEGVRVANSQVFASKRRLYEEALYGIAPGTPPDMFFTNRAGLRGLYLGGHTTFPACGAPRPCFLRNPGREAATQGTRGNP